MAGMNESCSVCGKGFDVQFRYQMEERDGGFAFFCSTACHGKTVRGEVDGGAVCDACGKRFAVELVSQVVRVKGQRRYACSDTCRTQVLAEAGGAKLASFLAPPPTPPTSTPTSTSTPPATTPSPATATSAPKPPIPLTRARKEIQGPRRLAIFNHKGGTGKTTTTVSASPPASPSAGSRCSSSIPTRRATSASRFNVKTERSLYHVLVMGLKPQDAAVEVRPNLDLICANETLAAAELYLAGRQNRDRILRERLMAASDAYDVVLVDCSPSLSLMNQNALVFADGILVPVACDFLSLVGVRQVIKTVKNVNALLHHPVQIWGVLPTFYDARARICRDAIDTLKQHFGERCLRRFARR